MIESINEHGGSASRMGDPGRVLDHEIKLRLVIRLRSEGKSSFQIGQILNEPDRTIRNWLSEASQLVKSENRQFIGEMFAIHQHRCEELYRRVHKKLKAKFSVDLVKVALAVLERQSKLLGLDAAKDRMRANDWLENATTEELIAEARRNNIPIPESFDVSPTYGVPPTPRA